MAATYAEHPGRSAGWYMTRLAMAASRKRGRRQWGPGRGQGVGFPMGGPGGWWGSGPRVGRGDVRAAVLALLAEGPMHGYQIMQELSERTGGAWQPSPGSIYPTLQLLEDEGLVRSEDREGKRVYTITETGRSQAAGDGPPPWKQVVLDDAMADLRDTAVEVGAAVMQVARAGSEADVEEARRILVETRRRLYRLLAGDESGDPKAP